MSGIETKAMQAIMLKPIVLVGMPGCGKSRVGRLLAQALACAFFDSDAESERVAGCSISTLFATEGEAAFRALEKQVLLDLLTKPPCVIASGGGAVLDGQTRQQLRQHAITVWLQADLAVIAVRVKQDSNRPLLQQPDPQQYLAQLLAQREGFYQQSDVQVASNGTASETVRAVLLALQAYGITL